MMSKASAKLLLVWLACLQAEGANLLEKRESWSASAQAPTTLTILPGEGGSLRGELVTKGEREDFPRFHLRLPGPQDWRGYHSLRLRMRIDSGDAVVTEKKLNFVFYDRNTRLENVPGNPAKQQGIRLSAAANGWTEAEIPLTGLRRSAIETLEIYVYANPPVAEHRCLVEIAKLELIGPAEGESYFDGVSLAGEKLLPPAGPVVRQVRSDDGLALGIDAAGRVAAVSLDDKPFQVPAAPAGGFFLRDAVKRDGPKEQVEGMEFSSRCESRGGYLEAGGKLRSTSAGDRLITAYFVLPVAKDGLRWGESISASETASTTGKFEFVHTKYPLAAVTLPGTGGLSLAIRLDEPVRYRLAYNPEFQCYFAAFDIALTAEKPEAEFRVILYRHDPAWGFRSALQRYYDFFPGFFEKHVPIDGGWGVWRSKPPTDDDLATGYAYSWGPSLKADVLSAQKRLGILNLPYIEPEYWQMSLTDLPAPGDAEALARLRKIAAGDEEEWKRFSVLRYTATDSSGHHRSADIAQREFYRQLATATLNSISGGPGGALSGQVARRDWIGENGVGAMFSCNLDPGIPAGKGRFNTDVAIRAMCADYEKATGARIDGLSLDCFLGAAPDFRRDHFKYLDSPLAFFPTPGGLQAGIPGERGSIEWMKDLKSQPWWDGRVLMANLGDEGGGERLTFAAPWLDVFGIEHAWVPDPDFLRTMARNKPVTDLPYSPRAPWVTAYLQVHGIFPGDGHDRELMKKQAPVLRAMMREGWNPVTGARASSPALRLERYGRYLVAHNTTEQVLDTVIKVEAPAAQERSIKLEAKETRVLDLLDKS